MNIHLKHSLLGGFLIVVMSACSHDNDLPTGETTDPISEEGHFSYTEIELEILANLNDHRQSLGLNTLSRVDEISLEAFEHNNNMIRSGTVSHANFQQRYLSLVEKIGAKAVSENIGHGYPTAEAVIQAWLSSDGHKSNIEGNYTHVGISVVEDRDGVKYFTNIFVRK